MGRKTVYITGAGSGIGQELAKRYIKTGANLALFDLCFSEQTKELFEDSRLEADQRIAYYQADVTDYATLEDCVQKAEVNVGLPDMAVHCAGIQDARPFDEMPQKDFERLVSINLFGSRNFAQACMPALVKNANGAQLAFIASMAGMVGNYGYAAYCSSKFAVVGFAQTLRLELAPKGVRVQVICPPEVDTPMGHQEHENIHPVTLKLKLMAGSLKLDYAIDKIMDGLDSKAFVIIPGKLAKFTYWINRLVPVRVSNFLVDRIVQAELRKL